MQQPTPKTQERRPAMETIWAPWRIHLLRQEKPAECFFCSYLQGAEEDEKNLVLERGNFCFVVMNRYPYNNGHLLIACREHEGDPEALSGDTLSEMMAMTVRWKSVLAQTISPQGFNIGMNVGKVAGAGVADHLHLHLVPRWNGDTNFMCVVSDLKIINQSLDELYAILRSKCRQLAQCK